MKRILCCLVVLTTLCAWAGREELLAGDIARRLSPRLAQKVQFKRVSTAADSADWFSLEDCDGRVRISGNNCNSMAVGLNHYLRHYCHTTVSWYASQPVWLPATLPAVGTKVTARARVKQRFFLNYCTFGYTMPFWQWSDWERLIDWMALNGINMPLAITGQESVWLNVWTRMGLTAEQVRSYFTGPAYLPWHRMANIDAWCGPLPQEWLQGQQELQKMILFRERELHMRPVLPAFAGHVPKQLKQLHPEADIKELSAWDGFGEPYHTYFLNSEDPLFAQIQRLFLQEQKRLYGTDHIYGIDLFNEMTPPSLEPDYLHRVTQHVFESLTAVDAQAQWLQMGWFLYYQRGDFTPQRTAAMLTGVPQGRMTLLDYFCDRREVWRMRDGFSGQPYIWCYLGNFGGNGELQGNPLEAGRRLEQALREGGSNLVGIGSTLEGLDVQQFPYEYIFSKAWTLPGQSRQLAATVAASHAGRATAAGCKAWQLLLDSVLTVIAATKRVTLMGSCPDYFKEPSYTAPRHNVAALYEAWQWLLRQDSVVTDAATVDLVVTGRQLLADLFFKQKQAFDQALKARDLPAMTARADTLRQLLADADQLCAAHPHSTLAQWVGQARALSASAATQDYYEMNARRLVTTWGGNLNDYAGRLWSGLIAGYYARRWSIYLDEALAAVRMGRGIDDAARRARTAAVQEAFPTPHGVVAGPRPCADVLQFSRQLLAKYAGAFGRLYGLKPLP